MGKGLPQRIVIFDDKQALRIEPLHGLIRHGALSIGAKGGGTGRPVRSAAPRGPLQHTFILMPIGAEYQTGGGAQPVNAVSP
jgi:hypothetical protein